MRTEQGFGLVEFMVGAVLTSLVVGSVVALLISGQNGFESQQAEMAMRQEARVALDKLARELRVAGYRTNNVPEVISQATATTVQFVADVDDGDNGAPCDSSFETAVNGGVERITYALVSEELLRSVDCWDGSTWTPEINSQTLAADLVSSQTVFRYFDETGTELVPSGALTATQRAAVRSIIVDLDLLDNDVIQVVGDAHTGFNLGTQVELHNMW